jgi:hypothetical protein
MQIIQHKPSPILMISTLVPIPVKTLAYCALIRVVINYGKLIFCNSLSFAPELLQAGQLTEIVVMYDRSQRTCVFNIKFDAYVTCAFPRNCEISSIIKNVLSK